MHCPSFTSPSLCQHIRFLFLPHSRPLKAAYAYLKCMIEKTSLKALAPTGWVTMDVLSTYATNSGPVYFINVIKKGKDQESIQSSTTPDPGYQTYKC